jgi:hypothetical protein
MDQTTQEVCITQLMELVKKWNKELDSNDIIKIVAGNDPRQVCKCLMELCLKESTSFAQHYLDRCLEIVMSLLPPHINVTEEEYQEYANKFTKEYDTLFNWVMEDTDSCHPIVAMKLQYKKLFPLKFTQDDVFLQLGKVARFLENYNYDTVTEMEYGYFFKVTVFKSYYRMLGFGSII